MYTFRILHLSDFHFSNRLVEVILSPVPGYSYDRIVVSGLARFVLEQANNLDLVLITGDLAATGRRADLQRAVEYIDAKPSAGFLSESRRPTLHGGGLPIVLMPGNHDRYQGLWGAAGGTSFDDVFQQYWKVGQGVQYCLINNPDIEDCLAIILGDFSLASCRDADPPAPGCLGQGLAYQNVIDRMTSLTASVRDKDPAAAVIWAVHFAPGVPHARPVPPVYRRKSASSSC